jgi:hypothetical protein
LDMKCPKCGGSVSHSNAITDHCVKCGPIKVKPMDLTEYNDVTVKLVGFVISCKGILRSDDMDFIGMDEDGSVVTETDGATLETSGGSCRNVRTGDVRIFPAGVYRLSNTHGIEKISEIEDDG